MVGIVRDGEQMGWDLSPLLALVFEYNIHAIDGQSLVGVDGNTEESGVGLNKGNEKIYYNTTPTLIKYNGTHT